MQPHPAGCTAQATRALGFLAFQLAPETIGASERGRLLIGLLALLALQALHTLLDQHAGHVAHRTGLGIGQQGQPFTQLLWQHHLNPGGLGPAA